MQPWWNCTAFWFLIHCMYLDSQEVQGTSPHPSSTGGLTSDWQCGCCSGPSRGISPSVGRSGKRQCFGCSLDKHIPCSSTGCRPGQRYPAPADPQFLQTGGNDVSASEQRPLPDTITRPWAADQTYHASHNSQCH